MPSKNARPSEAKAKAAWVSFSEQASQPLVPSCCGRLHRSPCQTPKKNRFALFDT